MKEATGELNMTVITIIAIGAIVAFFWVMWPQIQQTISGVWNSVDEGNGGEQCDTVNGEYWNVHDCVRQLEKNK